MLAAFSFLCAGCVGQVNLDPWRACVGAPPAKLSDIPEAFRVARGDDMHVAMDRIRESGGHPAFCGSLLGYDCYDRVEGPRPPRPPDDAQLLRAMFETKNKTCFIILAHQPEKDGKYVVHELILGEPKRGYRDIDHWLRQQKLEVEFVDLR